MACSFGRSEMKLFVIAGEPSGDKLGAALMKGLVQLQPQITFAGIGGPLMEAQGLASRFPMEELSIMGLVEILPKYFHLKRRIRETAKAVITSGAKALITIDSPDFCLRVAALVRAVRGDFPTIHYVAPSVWAWREGRATKMARHIDHVLALLPFEPPLMEAAGMTCDFVGHPVVAEPLAVAQDVQGLRAKYDLQGDYLLALPGSRKGEVTRLAATFGKVAEDLGLPVVLPTVRGVEPLVRELTRDWKVQPLILTEGPEKRAAFAGAHLALAASGTVSLELAANGVPMVIAYDMNWLSRVLIKRALKVDTVTLVNLVAESRTIPEFLGADCQPAKIASALAALVAPESPQRQAQLQAMDLCMIRLGRDSKDPGLRAAASVLEAILRLDRPVVQGSK